MTGVSPREQAADRATWRLATFIDDWLYAIRGARERRDHRQAFERIRYLRNHLRYAPADRRRAAIELYQTRKAKTNG